MIILGLNAFHGDSSACIIVDGKLVAAVEEERFTRLKHWAGFPKKSIEFCLEQAGVKITDVDHVAINRDPGANVLKKALYAFSKRPSLKLVTDRLKNASKVQDIRSLLELQFKTQNSKLKTKFHNVEHHIAHLASSFFVSPFQEAACLSIDGFGDFIGAMWGVGRDKKIDVKGRTFFPHSLGLAYLAFTQYLGFPEYGDEYKVMGLSAYGETEYMEEMNRIIKKGNNGNLFGLDLDLFVHHSTGITMTWNHGRPKVGPVYSDRLEELLGPSRRNGAGIDDRHKNIAASLQLKYEEVFIDILNKIYNETGYERLALAGGCAMNSLANGKILERTPFREVYIQPAAGDAGGAIGAAYYVWNQILDKPRSFVLAKPYLGPEFSEDEISKQLSVNSEQFKKQNCLIEKIQDDIEICKKTAEYIADGKIVGWFQGRMEWGPRALGNRSILCDPRRPDMKEILNTKIKLREEFRPFAPSVQLEAMEEYFEIKSPEPFMTKVAKVKPDKRDVIPAVTHVDGTGRLQTVSREDNPEYWLLIEEFRKLSGVPVLLNTSFNENEPIVCNPSEAIECFLRTRMDVLVMGKYMITRE